MKVCYRQDGKNYSGDSKFLSLTGTTLRLKFVQLRAFQCIIITRLTD